jgi:hypothetical protein
MDRIHEQTSCRSLWPQFKNQSEVAQSCQYRGKCTYCNELSAEVEVFGLNSGRSVQFLWLFKNQSEVAQSCQYEKSRLVMAFRDVAKNKIGKLPSFLICTLPTFLGQQETVVEWLKYTRDEREKMKRAPNHPFFRLPYENLDTDEVLGTGNQQSI